MDSQATVSTQIDTGIICLALIAQYLRLPADSDGIRHDLGLVAGVARSDDVIRANFDDSAFKATSASIVKCTVAEPTSHRTHGGDKRLRLQDWKSGDKREVVEIVAPFGGAEEMVKDLEEKVFGK